MSQSFQITNLTLEDHPRALEVWEAAVRATHDFLDEEAIQSLKPLVQDACLNSMPVYCVRDPSQSVIGFIGVETPKIEALFIDPDWRGNGIGRQLVEYAVHQLGAELVDVNEQNPQALGFYQHLGFEVAHRSDVDGFGNPYPLLHLKLAE
ncbi:MAG: acetyltransferase [Planctomycetaceae bacterium]|nr:acetyltransferase [Planctomycetaceae bacterium]MCA9019272.1 acetyltransferase [Planctomycetaceae bacterium]